MYFQTWKDKRTSKMLRGLKNIDTLPKHESEPGANIRESKGSLLVVERKENVIYELND